MPSQFGTDGLKEAAPMNKLPKPSSEILVNHEVNVQKLPRGQNLVSVTRPGQTTIQVKLPLTGTVNKI